MTKYIVIILKKYLRYICIYIYIHIFFSLICLYLELFLPFVRVILLFARKYTLQQDAGSKQFTNTNSTRRIDEKMK